jgi:hypothetical protein
LSTTDLVRADITGFACSLVEGRNHCSMGVDSADGFHWMNGGLVEGPILRQFRGISCPLRSTPGNRSRRHRAYADAMFPKESISERKRRRCTVRTYIDYPREANKNRSVPALVFSSSHACLGGVSFRWPPIWQSRTRPSLGRAASRDSSKVVGLSSFRDVQIQHAC